MKHSHNDRQDEFNSSNIFINIHDKKIQKLLLTDNLMDSICQVNTVH